MCTCVCVCVRCRAEVVSTSVVVLHKIYILNVPEMLHYRSVCVGILLYVPKAVSADALLCRLMADYDIKCL